jgi:hypothetical protein
MYRHPIYYHGTFEPLIFFLVKSRRLLHKLVHHVLGKDVFSEIGCEIDRSQLMVEKRVGRLPIRPGTAVRKGLAEDMIYLTTKYKCMQKKPFFTKDPNTKKTISRVLISGKTV